jgi:hypothetical protein
VEVKVAVARFVLTSSCPAVVILCVRLRAQTILDDIVEQRPFYRRSGGCGLGSINACCHSSCAQSRCEGRCSYHAVCVEPML